jgi:predicted Zn finger-like uncharacterized protein
MTDPLEIVTRCPGCSTAFRASQEHLSARAGKVRCGRCNAVFDAREHALPADSSMATQRPAQGLPTYSSHITLPEQGFAPEVGHDDLVLTYAPAEAPAAEIAAEVTSDAAPSADVADPNFELDFGRSPVRASRFRLWLGAMCAVLLLALLAGQAIFHFRGDIALLFPAAKTAMERACSHLGCRLPLPKRVDMLSIESSDLQADTLNPGIMVLSATLRNRAPFPQTPPALELTLTDAQDQALARRVLGAAEYVHRDSVASPVENSVALDNLFPGGTELPIRVYFDASAVKPTGYRLYLFYP